MIICNGNKFDNNKSDSHLKGVGKKEYNKFSNLKKSVLRRLTAHIYRSTYLSS